MNVKRKIVWMGMLLAVLWGMIPGKDVQAEAGKARALIVARGEYKNPQNTLSPAPENDGENFRRVLEQAYGDSLVETSVRRKDGVDTVAGIQAAIYETFKDASDNDINYFYYSGHGMRTGSGDVKESTLFLEKSTYMTARDLAEAFDGVKGRNILVMDCCYSGGMVSRSASSVSAVESFAEDFVDTFQAVVSDGERKARSPLTNSRFQLLMAAGEEELCWQQKIKEDENSPKEEEVEAGMFTATLCYGCGVDPAKVQKGTGYGLDTASADYNLDGEISLEEIAKYIENTYHYTANHVRCYPANDSRSFLPVGEGLVPGAAFRNAIPERRWSENATIELSGCINQAVSAEYAVYQGDTESLGAWTLRALREREMPKEREGVWKVAEGQISREVYQEKEYTVHILAEGLEEGKYYVVIRIPEQEIPYLLPFALERAAGGSLEENFQLLLSGSHYTSGELGSGGIFTLEDGNELVIRADFGVTTDPDEAAPYLSCYIYGETEQGEPGTLPIRILGRNVLMQIVPTAYQTGGEGNVLKRGNCYREFYWDGKDSDGQFVKEGRYYAVVNAVGAVEDSRIADVYVKEQPSSEADQEKPSETEQEEQPETPRTEVPETPPAEPLQPEGTEKKELIQDAGTETLSVKIGKKAVKSITVGRKEKVRLKSVVHPQKSAVSYSSSNPRVAAVDASGKVTAKKVGRAVITVRTAKGTTVKLNVRVKKAPARITLPVKKKTLRPGKSCKVRVRFPAKTASYKVTFTSSRKKVASVDSDGKIRALKKGKTVITVHSFNGKKARMQVTVK